jgi:HEAT repeat protein
VLVESLQDRHPAVRDQAADVLSRLRPELDPAALLPAAGDARAEVRTRTARVIGALGDRRGGDILLRLVADPEPQVRAAAARALPRIGDPRAAGALLPLLADPSLEARRAAVDAFATLRDPRAIPGLVSLLQNPDWDLGAKAWRVLASLDDARALDALLAAPFHTAALMDVLDGLSDPAAFDDIVPLLGHDYRHVRAAAARALGRYPRPGVVEALAGVLRDAVGPDAAASLVQLGDPRAASLLAGVLNDPDANPAIKRAMAKILADIATRPVVTPLVDALSDRDAGVRETANAALGRLTCRNFGVDQARWREWWGAQSPSFPLGRCQ